ncbi:MAG: polysaccharide deacetylase family protein [Candidatus Eremiobacteraeota bacterium]|nr:polysaccharide deacetylase family protein [Candidatus Eremiobacteraeota bacterium]
MKRGVWTIVAIGAIALIAYGSWRLFVHTMHVQPALITPSMNAQDAIAPPFSKRISRVLHERARSKPTGRPKLIALTFDDGPYPVSTPLLLDALNRLHVRATFFLIGRDAEQWPGLAQRIESAGDEIADHTYTHPDLDLETRAAVRGEILKGRNVLFRLVHDPSVNSEFRPPHGRYTVATIEVAQQLGYQTILWTDDPGDWRNVTFQNLEQHLEAHATAPEIVLLHSGKFPTIAMLPAVVARFRAAGYRFVTVREMIARVTPNELNHPVKRAI